VKIEDLIFQLQSMLRDYGNVKVECRNPAGKFDGLATLSAMHYGKPGDNKWVVYLDT